jgi:PAS domain S-box-containing protein
LIEIGREDLDGAVDLLKAIYTDSPIGIEIYDSEGKLIDLNQSCMELFGVSNKDDVKGFDLFNDPNIPTNHATRLRQRETVRFESTFDFDLVKKHNLYKTTKSGKIYIDVLITPLFIGENKSVSNYLVQVQDNSDRKVAELKLIDFNEDLESKIQERTKQIRKSEEDWRVLVEEAPDIIFTVERNLQISYINKVPQGMLPDEAIGKDVLNYIDPSYHETVKNSIEKVFQTGESEYYEISARGPNDTKSWYSTRLGAIKQNKKVVSVMLITRDISERKRIEQTLKESEEKFRSIAEGSLMGITTVQNNHIQYVNQQAADTIGYSVSEMLNWDFKKILKNIHPDDLGLVMENMKKVLTNSPDALNQLEYRIINKSGEIVWVVNYGSQIQYEGKSAQLITSLDITEKKLAEEKLSDSEEKFRTITEQSLMGIAILQDDRFIYVNKQIADIFEYTTDEMKNWGKLEYAKLIHPDDRQMALEQARLKQLGLSGAIIHYQFRGITKNGSVKYLEIYSNGFNYRGGIADLINIIDITEKKEAEQKLKDSEEGYRTLIENVSGVIFEIDLDGKISYSSPQSFTMLGYEPDELINQNAFRFIHPDDLEEVLFRQNKAVNTGDVGLVEFRLQHKEGYYLSVSSRGQLIERDNKKKIVGLFSDISERKAIEKKVQQVRDKAEMYLNLVNVIIVALDRDGNISMINQKGNEILEWNNRELIGKNWFDNCLPSQDRERVKDYFKKLVNGEIDVIPFYENPVITKNGIEKLVAWSTILFSDSEGRVNGVLSSGEDITERKKAEEKIGYQAKLVEEVSDAIISTDLEFKVVTWNKAAELIYGWKTEEVVGKNLTEIIPIEYPYDKEEDVINLLFESGSWKGEVIQYNKKGFPINIYASVSLIKNVVGEPAGAVAINRDITERKKAQKKIQESENQLMELIEAVPVGISISTPEGKVIECNSNSYQVLGYDSKEDFLKTPATDFYNNPEDRDKLIELLEKGLVKDFETQFKRKDGTIFWGSLTSIAHEKGEQTTFINSFQDITARKLAEIKIEQSEAELSAIYNYTPISILLVDNERRIRKINKSALKFTDLQEEEVFGIHGGEALRCLYSIEDSQGCGFSEYCNECVIRNTVLDTFKTHKPHINVEATLFLLPGNEADSAHLLFSTVPLKVEGEERVLVSFIEITERIKTEQQLRESEEKYRNLSNQYKMLLESITDAVYALNTDWEYILVNKNAEKFVNMPIENLLGHKIFDVFPGIEYTPFFKTYENVMNMRNATRVVESFSHVDGRERYYDVSIYPIEEGILCFAKDVTDDKNIEKRLKESELKLKESEERYKYLANELEVILDHIPGIVVYKDTENNILRVNKFMADAHHLQKEDMEGKNSFQFYPKEEAQAYWEDDRIVVNSKQPKLDIIEPWETSEGRRWVNTSKIPYIDEDGSVNGIIAVAFDVTDRIKAEQQLKESEEKFRTIAEQSSIGVIIQQDGYITFANTAVSDIVEYPIEEFNNQAIENIYKMVYKEDLPLMIDKFKLSQTEGFELDNQYELRLLSKSGEIKWVSIFTKPIIYLGRNAILSTIIDVTDKKKVEEELKDVNRLKSELLSRTSHELKTPLVSIKGYADLLLSQHYEALDFYTISILHEIKQGCTRLESLIKDLIEASKLESGEIMLKKSEEDLAFLIRFCIRDLQGLLETRNHNLILEIQEDMITLLEKERIYDVIINLLSNAIKYTPSGGTIKIQSEKNNGSYVISIVDDGIGLATDEMSKIFQKFGKIERYGKGLDVISEGTGLGLYISKNIIELHDGEIWAESKGKSKGSTFSFSLPIIRK